MSNRHKELRLLSEHLLLFLNSKARLMLDNRSGLQRILSDEPSYDSPGFRKDLWNGEAAEPRPTAERWPRGVGGFPCGHRKR